MKHKCKKCRKPIHREEIHEYNVGYFHPHCYETYKKKKLKAEADKTWHEGVMREYGEQCTFCINEAYCGHHFYFKGNHPEIRYYIPNGIPICQSCHFKIHQNDPKEMEDIVRIKRGKEWEADLKAQLNKPIPQTSIAYYKNIIEELK